MSEEESAPTESARRAKTRERLMDAAFDVFSEMGIHAASVELICERADFSRGAFYSNFSSKEELFLAMAARGNKTQLEILRSGVEGMGEMLPALLGPNPGKLTSANLGKIVAGFLDHQSDNARWALFQSELRMLAMRDPEVGTVYLEQQHDVNTEFGIIIAAAFDAVGLTLSLSANETARLLILTYEQALQEAIMRGEPDVEKATNVLAMERLTRLIERLTSAD